MRTPTEIFEEVLSAWDDQRRHFAFTTNLDEHSAQVRAYREEFHAAIAALKTNQVAPFFDGTLDSELVPALDGDPAHGGIRPGAYRVESVTAGEGPGGPTFDMELAPLPPEVSELFGALKASLAQDRRFRGGELAGDD